MLQRNGKTRIIQTESYYRDQNVSVSYVILVFRKHVILTRVVISISRNANYYISKLGHCEMEHFDWFPR